MHRRLNSHLGLGESSFLQLEYYSVEYLIEYSSTWQIPRAATPPGKSNWKVVWNRAEIPLGWVNMSAYSFFVCGPKFTIFSSPNVGGVVVDQLLFRFSTCGYFPEIFAIKFESCHRERWIVNFFALPNFRGQAFPKNSAHLNTPALRDIAWKSFVTLFPLVPKL